MAWPHNGLILQYRCEICGRSFQARQRNVRVCKKPKCRATHKGLQHKMYMQLSKNKSHNYVVKEHAKD